jgi:hypothetical protein
MASRVIVEPLGVVRESIVIGVGGRELFNLAYFTSLQKYCSHVLHAFIIASIIY